MLYVETETEIKEIIIYDVYGRHQVTKTSSHQGDLSIDVSRLNSGVYFIRIKTDSGDVVRRFVKK
jgi:hypothetical protein